MVIRDQKQNLEEKLDAVINDPVNHPSHYTSSKIEVIEYICIPWTSTPTTPAITTAGTISMTLC